MVVDVEALVRHPCLERVGQDVRMKEPQVPRPLDVFYLRYLFAQFAEKAARHFAWRRELHKTADVHHHVAPPAFVRELIARGYNEPPQFNWTVQKSLDDMAQAGVATALLSITTRASGSAMPVRPGVSCGCATTTPPD